MIKCLYTLSKDNERVYKVNVTYITMGKINSGVVKTRGRISAQTRTTQRAGNIRQQKKRVTVATRKNIKRKVNTYRGFWLW